MSTTINPPPSNTQNPQSGSPAKGTCPNCDTTESWGGASFCPSCGYYPKLGTTLSSDVMKPAYNEDEDPLDNIPLEIPQWLWISLGGMALFLGGSLYARFYVTADGPRTIWSLGQIFVGMALLVGAHFQAYLRNVSKNDRASFTDIFLHPIEIWRPVFSNLPETGSLVSRATWGVTATAMAFLIVGGVSRSELADVMGAQEGEAQMFNPLKLIMSQTGKMAQAQGAQQPVVQEDAPESMEEAVAQLTEQIGVDQLQNMGPVGVPAAPGPDRRSQCAIIGYTKSVKGELRSVLVAKIVQGEPAEFVAKVPTAGMPDDIVQRLQHLLPQLRVRRPAVDCPITAYWVDPQLSCQIGYDAPEESENGDEGEWKNIEFLRLYQKAGGSTKELEDATRTIEQTHSQLENALPALNGALGG